MSHALRLLAGAAVVILLCSCGGDPPPPAARPQAGSGAEPSRDAGARPSSRPDAGRWQAPTVVPPDPESGEEFLLSQTGLYRDIAELELAPDLIEFEPSHALWSDGADKRRWLRLPRGKRIDSSDVDHWQFPVGTMAFKEFSLHGRRIETRLIMRTGEDTRDYWMGAFVWTEDGSDALFAPDGESNAGGTAHDVPTVKNCFTCHDGEAGRILGYSAVQQPAAPAALLTNPLLRAFIAPGDPRASAALGYLHANCGPCHNPNGSARPDTDMDTRLAYGNYRVGDTRAFQTLVGVELQYFDDSALTLRIAPGNPAESGVLFRMTERGPKTQMPPIASELADDDGIAAVRAWIERL